MIFPFVLWLLFLELGSLSRVVYSPLVVDNFVALLFACCGRFPALVENGGQDVVKVGAAVSSPLPKQGLFTLCHYCLFY